MYPIKIFDYVLLRLHTPTSSHVCGLCSLALMRWLSARLEDLWVDIFYVSSRRYYRIYESTKLPLAHPLSRDHEVCIFTTRGMGCVTSGLAFVAEDPGTEFHFALYL